MDIASISSYLANTATQAIVTVKEGENILRYRITKPQYNIDSGAQVADKVLTYEKADVDNQITEIDAAITALSADKTILQALITAGATATIETIE